MGVLPRLADVSCTRMRFDPGDRILVKVRQDLSREDAAKLRKSVERWAGNAVEVLVMNANNVELEVVKPRII